MKVITWKDLFNLMQRDKAGRWYANAGSVEAEYIALNDYRAPSYKHPHSHAKPLMTAKYAKWCLANHPEHAAALGLMEN